MQLFKHIWITDFIPDVLVQTRDIDFFKVYLVLFLVSYLHPGTREPDNTDCPDGPPEPGRLQGALISSGGGAGSTRRASSIIQEQKQSFPDQTQRVAHIYKNTMKRQRETEAASFPCSKKHPTELAISKIHCKPQIASKL